MPNQNNSNNQRKFRLRCTYIKAGRLAYLSHLEVARALERCVRRAGLPFAVSQGFSPHMLLHFGSALPVGIGSTCEIFDLTLREYVSPAHALEALQRASVKDLQVQSCKYVDNSAPAASVAYPISTYEVILSAHPHQLDAQQFGFPEEITLIKKKKERVMRVSEYLVGDVCLNELDENSENEETADDGKIEREKCAKLTFSLVAKPTGSLRPDKLLDATLAQYNSTHCALDKTSSLKINTFTRINQLPA